MEHRRTARADDLLNIVFAAEKYGAPYEKYHEEQ